MEDIIDFITKNIPGFEIPERFFDEHREKSGGMYFATCSDKEFLLIAPIFVKITGFEPEFLLNGGLRWWFSIIHPEDLEPMLKKIFKLCFLRPIHKRLNKPFNLEYRIKKPDGKWIWLRETKCIIGITEEGKNLYILGILEDITVDKAEEEILLKKILDSEAENNVMLKAALPIIDPEFKRSINPFLSPNQYSQPKGLIKPTPRELEVLEMIGQGLATKEIADLLFISVNTVETHRRHLLEKLKVKNSMELIKSTRNAFWLRTAG